MDLGNREQVKRSFFHSEPARALTELFLGVWLRGRGLDVGLGLLLLLFLQTLGVHGDPTVAVQLLSLRRHHLVVCSRAVVRRLLVLFAAVPPVEPPSVDKRSTNQTACVDWVC